MKPYYEDDACKIYHGDALDGLAGLSDVDVVITSPPYNLGTSTGGGMHAGSLRAADLAGGYDGGYDDAMPQDEYDEWQRACVAAMWKTLNDRGAIFYNHKPRIQAGIAKLPTEYGPGLPVRQVITWDREQGFNFSTSFFLPKSEWIVVWARPGFRLADKKRSAVGDVWRFPPETADDHPAPFPLALPARVIESCGPSLVVDPFMGGGTTLRAAKDANVRAIGIEQSERYCEIAAKRLAQEVLPL